jgi:hypothetical protein
MLELYWITSATAAFKRNANIHVNEQYKILLYVSVSESERLYSQHYNCGIILWDMMVTNLVEVGRNLAGTHFLHLQARIVSKL